MLLHFVNEKLLEESSHAPILIHIYVTRIQ